MLILTVAALSALVLAMYAYAAAMSELARRGPLAQMAMLAGTPAVAAILFLLSLSA